MYILEKNKIKDENEWVSLDYHEKEHTLYIDKVWVKENKRGLGLAKDIMDYFIDLYPNKEIIGLCSYAQNYLAKKANKQ